MLNRTSSVLSNPTNISLGKSVQHLDIIKKQDDYETPFNLLNHMMSTAKVYPNLDVCATAKQAKRLGFRRHYSKRDKPLKLVWYEDFYMNPPYSEVSKWLPYAYDQAIKNKVNGLVLTYAKTDTKWWHNYIENNPLVEVHFIKGRVRFYQNGKITANSAPYPSVFFVFRCRRRRRKNGWSNNTTLFWGR